MDEAYLLGDRIAIMAAGVVEYCGSSHVLKKLCGFGDRLIVVKDKESFFFDKDKESFDTERLTWFIRSYVDNVTIEADSKDQVAYILHDEWSPSFAELFGALDRFSPRNLIFWHNIP